MEMNCQLRIPAALPPGKEPLVHIGWEGGASESVWTWDSYVSVRSLKAGLYCAYRWTDGQTDHRRFTVFKN